MVSNSLSLHRLSVPARRENGSHGDREVPRTLSSSSVPKLLARLLAVKLVGFSVSNRRKVYAGGARLPGRLSLATQGSQPPVASRPNLAAHCTSDGSVATEVLPIEKRFAAFPTVVDINQIRDILPHRFPFLLVDRVIEYQPGVTAVAIKNVTINDNFFPGHFPERPTMPGVLMVEALAQVGGIVMLQPEVGGSRENFFFAGIDKVRFLKPVIAGDTLVMRMTLVKLQRRFGIAKMEGKAYVGGEVVCEGEFLLATGSSE